MLRVMGKWSSIESDEGFFSVSKSIASRSDDDESIAVSCTASGSSEGGLGSACFLTSWSSGIDVDLP
jgi:hypothetical protein